MTEPVEVSKKCYEDIEVWLEDIYHTYPFHRIFRSGKRLGHDGFMENFDLQVEAQGPIIEVRVIGKVGSRLAHSAKFERGVPDVQ